MSAWPAELAAAFVAAQAELVDVARGRTASVETRTGGSYSYSYADLADVLTTVRPVLAAHQLAVVQPVQIHDGMVEVTTVLVHASGQLVEFGPIAFDAGATPQAAGSATTYARRYGLLAALGLATEDDDGAAASTTPRARGRQQRGAAVESQLATEAQLRGLAAAMTAAGVTDRAERLTVVAQLVGREVASSRELTRREASDALDALRQRALPEEPAT